MPVPAIPVILAALSPWITRLIMAKGVLVLAGFMGRLGIVLATNEIIIQPAIDSIMNMWVAIPPKMICWLQTFGVTKVLSIMVSTITIVTIQRVFLGKSA